jgi:Uma2 family endonuclease
MHAYAMLDSLQEYLLVDSRSRQAELYRKLPGGCWEQWIAAPGESLKLDSLGLELAVDDMYEDAAL